MANIKITELTELAAVDVASADVLPIVDVDLDITKKIRFDALTKVAINSTPVTGGTTDYLFKVNGDGTIGQVDPTTVGSVTVGTTVFTSGTTGSILFIGSSAVVQQDNANLFWDDTNNWIAFGSSSPQGRVDIRAQNTASTDIAFRVRDTSNTYNLVKFAGDGEIHFMNQSGFDLFRIKSGGAFALGYNINMGNVVNTDVCINPASNMGATGDHRIAIGNTATCNAGYTVAVGRGSSCTGTASNAWGMDLIVSANYSTLIGSNFNGWTTNNIDNSFMWTSGAPGTGNYQSFFVNNKSNMVLMSQGQLTTGTHYNADATNTITIQNGTIPSGVVADATQIHAKDTSEGTPKSALAIFSETVPVTEAFTADTRVRVWWNGVEYYLGLEAV